MQLYTHDALDIDTISIYYYGYDQLGMWNLVSMSAWLCITFLDLLCPFSHTIIGTSLCVLCTHIESKFCNPHVKNHHHHQVCGICRMPFEACCPGVKFPGIICIIYTYKCVHVYMHTNTLV
jgi:hypothetical protein